MAGKHVICESPICTSSSEFEILHSLASKNNVVLMDSIKTAYLLGYNRMEKMIKSEIIGDVKSIDVTCTNLKHVTGVEKWGSLSTWGPIALYPVLSIFGLNYNQSEITTYMPDGIDLFTKIDFQYPYSVASVRVGSGVKSEGQLIISGTKGYIMVPSPWWKTEYFEVRYEDQNNNRRYFYKMMGDGLQSMFMFFYQEILLNNKGVVKAELSRTLVNIVEQLYSSKTNRIE